MMDPRPTRPLIYDRADLRLRVPCRPSDDRLLDDATVRALLPTLRIS